MGSGGLGEKSCNGFLFRRINLVKEEVGQLFHQHLTTLFFYFTFMTSLSEKTYGSRLLHAQDILSSLQNLPTYSSPNPEQTTANFSAFLALVKESNDSQSAAMQQYLSAVMARSDAFRGEHSIKTLFPKVRAAVLSQYGKKSQQYAVVSSIINKTRAQSTKLTPSAVPAPSSDPRTSTAGSDVSVSSAVPNTISQSQLSFGSLLGQFNVLIQTLAQMGDYAPANADLSVASLKAFSQNMDALNNNVAASLQNLQKQRAARNTNYSNLSVRAIQIKANVKSQFGPKSTEYKNVKGLEV